jgi:hypothetical protein
MTVIAPPEPHQEEQHELDALIEEARRRTRRRRLKYAAAVVGAALAGGGIFAGLELTGGSPAGQALPDGFQLVHARGPVSHVVMHNFPTGNQVLDLRTGRTRPAAVENEVWWDRKSGLNRQVTRVGGTVVSDLVRNTCNASVCIPPQPWFLARTGFVWRPNPCCAVVSGRGTYAGRTVVWIDGLVNGHRPRRSFERVGLDPGTHKPVVYELMFAGHVANGYSIGAVKTLDPDEVSFVVPKGGASEIRFPSSVPVVTGQGLEAARSALSRPTLWLGRSFAGQRLQRVDIGKDGYTTRAGAAQKVPYVIFDYGAFTIREYGRRPISYQSGPREGTALLSPGSSASFALDGVLVIVDSTTRTFPIDARRTIELTKALKPLPG